MTLREEFKKETGINWENSQGEPDIEYVLWLETKLQNTSSNSDYAKCIKELKYYIDWVNTDYEHITNVLKKHFA